MHHKWCDVNSNLLSTTTFAALRDSYMGLSAFYFERKSSEPLSIVVNYFIFFNGDYFNY